MDRPLLPNSDPAEYGNAEQDAEAMAEIWLWLCGSCCEEAIARKAACARTCCCLTIGLVDIGVVVDVFVFTAELKVELVTGEEAAALRYDEDNERGESTHPVRATFVQ